ncbi:MAG: 2Fe-2S iron-sulfur cluster binding domain-containing protein [Bacilli bacterium]|nr:2Fe-2S iron-sulfur cluster binding domain-containing protein [Bacilli bacterium]MBN2877458.1 2Fe-2S iron-sulfur cluster binding domain-containing protein [Bacilli bacterium]
MLVNVIVNQETKTFVCEPGDYLLDTLRAYNYLSVRRGCDNTSCGVCTVLLNGKPVPSCSVLTASVEGKSIITVEGIQAEAEKLGRHFGDEGADQCGYCNPSLALTVYAMKNDLFQPTEAEVREYLVGNLCRCTGYIQQERAIMKYLGDE